MLTSDGRLARRAVDGDNQAFVHIHRRHGPRVYNLLRRLTGDPDRAEDLTQETFLAAFRSLAGWRGDSALSTWLCGIAFRLYRSHQRSSGRLDDCEPLDDRIECHDTDPFLHCARQEAHHILETAIGRLPALIREVFILVRVEGMAYREAAELLDVPLGTVQSRLARATQMLRIDLAEARVDRASLPAGGERVELVERASPPANRMGSSPIACQKENPTNAL